MKLKCLSGVSMAVALMATAGVASAADMAAPPVYKAPPPAYLSDWSGFYVGLNGGGAWGNTSVDDPFSILSAKPKGGVFGGHAGYNWQYGSVVTGLEVDYDWADATDSNTLASGIINKNPASIDSGMKFDALATARARLGYLVLPNLLAYGTGGLAWGHSTLSLSATNVPGIGTGSIDANANNFGWAAGAGLEYKLWEHVLVRAEYLHYDFAATAYSFPLLISPNASSKIDAVRGGVSYKF